MANQKTLNDEETNRLILAQVLELEEFVLASKNRNALAEFERLKAVIESRVGVMTGMPVAPVSEQLVHRVSDGPRG